MSHIFDSHKSVAERLTARSKRVVSGCLEWTKSLDTWGYGWLRIDGVQVLAHRLSFQTFVGDIPEGLCVLHSCDNSKCIEPTHLFLGTQLDNHKDMVNKGRSRGAVGERNAKAKLTNEDVIAIKADHRRVVVIANEYDIHKNTVYMIKRNEIWKHLP